MIFVHLRVACVSVLACFFVLCFVFCLAVSALTKLNVYAFVEIEQEQKQAPTDEKEAGQHKEGLVDLAGLVLDVVLMGSPLAFEEARWTRVRSVVAGRLVNVYSGSDWLLRFVYRTATAQRCVVGIMPAPMASVENIDGE